MIVAQLLGEKMTQGPKALSYLPIEKILFDYLSLQIVRLVYTLF
jgi:hypothetical protein